MRATTITATGAEGRDCARRGTDKSHPPHERTSSSPAARQAGFFVVRDAIMDFSKLDGLIPAVVQDHQNGDVLMVGFMNPEAWDITLKTGYVTFFSRTRNKLWTKGETSGNKLAVRDILIDCDEDTVLVKAEPLGDAKVCHTGERTCFFVRPEGITIP
jgi:phosphoribosyl-AMP cyclohydrolase